MRFILLSGESFSEMMQKQICYSYFPLNVIGGVCNRNLTLRSFYEIGVSNCSLYKFSIAQKMVCFITSADNIFEDIGGQISVAFLCERTAHHCLTTYAGTLSKQSWNKSFKY